MWRSSILRWGRRFALGAVLTTSATPAPAYDPTPWLDDLDQVRTVLLTKYANLEWAVFDREADLPRLFEATRGRIRSASSDMEARAAFDRLAQKLGDGHVAFRWPAPKLSGAPDTPLPCSDYDPTMVNPPVAAYAPGYRPVATPHPDLFPAGIIESGEKRVGVIRVALFEPQGSPNLCHQALAALSIPAQGPCDDSCQERIGKFTARKFAEAFTDQIAAVAQLHPDALLVDITHNGGGSEWAEAAARELTPVRLKSEHLRFVRGAHWIKKFADLENGLREAAAKATPSDDRARLLRWAEEAAAKQHIAAQPCDAAPLWNGKKPRCEWLGSGFFATGLLDAADPEELRGKPWASDVFSPSEFPYTEGFWRGPLIVLVDSETWSAAEEFAAVLQDNHAAVIMGEPTGGAGCGHTDGGTPTTLKNSNAVMEVPDCARIRADGSNEVRGIQPDILVGFRHSDGPHNRARAFSISLSAAVARAERLRR